MLLTSCGTRPDMVKVVQDEFRMRGLPVIRVTFEERMPKYVGMCYGDRIDINQDYWVLMSDEEREALLYHEMGHCVFGWADIHQDIEDVMCYNWHYLSYYWRHNREKMLKNYWR